MALPRLTTGQYEGASTFLNATADEIDRLAVGCVVRRTTHGSLTNNTETALSWQALDLDTSVLGMWTPSEPSVVTCRVPGIYTITGQARFAYYTTNLGESGASDANFGFPYNTGQRAVRVVLGPEPPYAVIAAAKLATSVDGEGTTVAFSTTAALAYGDQVRLAMWQNSGDTINCAQTDFGGTFMTLSYSGPI